MLFWGSYVTLILNLGQFRTISGQVQEEKGLYLAPQGCTTFLDVSKPAMCYVTCFRIV